MDEQEKTELIKTQNTKQLPSEMYYNTADLSRLKYIKIIYTDLDGKSHEISTDVKFIGDVLISVYFRCNDDFNINYPQDITIKFITSEAMYYATAILQEIKKTDNMVYFSVIPPTKMKRQQKRKYVRVDIDRTCVLTVTNERGFSSTYLTRSINLSACGILLHNLESLDSNDILKDKVPMSKYDCFHIILFLEHNIVLKLFAIYVRHEYVNGSHRYAFRFMNMKQKDIDLICKYITSEQIKLLKLQLRYK